MAKADAVLKTGRKGVYEIRWCEGQRSMRLSTRTTDQGKAESKLRHFRRGNAINDSELTCGQALDFYMQEHVEKGPVVDKDRQAFAAKNLRIFFDSKVCRDLMPADITHYCANRALGGVGRCRARSNGTLRRELNLLVAAMNYSVRTRRMPASSMPYVQLPTAPASKDFWLTEEEAPIFQRIADAHGTRAALFIAIALNTAARKRSIESLTWMQVDLVARRIHFNPVGRLQSAKRRVAVPISNALLPRLLAAKAQPGRNEFVLGSDRPITEMFEAIALKAARETGNERFERVTPHTLRHTFATLAARAGVPIFEIAGILGDSIETCAKNYLHHCPEHLRSAVNFAERAA